jgi:tetraacyldisaccharide 4'-kinase
MPIDENQFRAIISGRRRDIGARVVSALLGIASLGYRLVVNVRNRLYDSRLLKTHKAGPPVLCVGNLTTGGTGKTPLVIWLTRLLVQRDLRIAILTRGYKTKEGALSDEPAELAWASPGAPVVVNPDRVAGAAEAVRSHRAQVLLMDDGFQHRRLARDLDIVAIDATAPFGYERLLPAGLLREPIGGLKRAGAVVLTRCDLVAAEDIGRIEARVRQVNPDLVVAQSIHAPVGLHVADGSSSDLERLRGRKVFAFCGLGNPASFLRTVETCGGKLVGSQTFNDHHAYTDHDLAALHSQARSLGAELLLTSQKDWTKIAPLALPQTPPLLAYLAVELRFTSGGESLTTLIDQALTGTMVRL